MATYKVGKVKINGNGLMTGTGTNWTAANALVRVGATVVLATNPVRIYTVGSIISATSIQLSDWGSDAAITTDTNYSILLHDGLTVQGLAQDTAETLRYYRNFESTLGDASKLNVGEASGNVMKVGAFGLGVVKPVNAMATKTYSTALELMKDIRAMGSGWWRAAAVTESGLGIYNHGSGFASVCADNQSILNIDFATGKAMTMATTTANMNSGMPPARNVLYGTANKPDINSDTNGVLSLTNGGTGGKDIETALLGLGVRGEYPVLKVRGTPASGANDWYQKIATISDPGDGGAQLIFEVSSATGIGSPDCAYDIVMINPRRLVDGNYHQNVCQMGFGPNSSPMRIVLLRVGGNSFDVYMKCPRFVPPMVLRVISRLGSVGGTIKGPLVSEGGSDSAWLSEGDIPNISTGYVTPRRKSIDDFDNNITLAGGRVGSNIPDADVRLLFSNHGGIRYERNKNVTMFTSTGNFHIRPLGENNSSKQFVFEQGGNATASGGSWLNSSDIRLKRSFAKIENPLEAVMSFRGATYEMKASGVRSVGILAQDIEPHCPDAIARFDAEISEGEAVKDAMAVNTSGVAAAYSVQALKEVVKLMDLMLEDPEAASVRIKALKAMINDDLPE